MLTRQSKQIRYELKQVEPKIADLMAEWIELICAVAILGERGFATSSRQSQTVSSTIQFSNRSSVVSLGVRSLVTGSQNIAHNG